MRGRGWPWRNPHHSGHFSQTKSTWQRLHLGLLGITGGLIEYPESIECSVPPAMCHDYWQPQNLGRVMLLVHRADALQSPWPRFSANTRSTVHSNQQTAYGTHTWFTKHNSHVHRWESKDSSGAKGPLWSGCGVTEPRRLIGWRLAGLDGGRKSLLWS